MTKKQKIHSRDEWAQFAIGYLHLAELAFREILDGKHSTDKEKGYFGPENIYIPAVFNLKHGIEILLKTLSIEFLEKRTLEQDDYSHDINEIFFSLRKKVSQARIKKVILKFEKEYPKLSARQPKMDEKSIFDILEKIITKYHNLSFIKDKIEGDYVITDSDNTALKYPTNSLNIQIDYEKVSKKFSRLDILSSLEDCLQLESILWQLYLLIYIERK